MTLFEHAEKKTVKLTPRHKRVLNVLEDGQWHSGTEIILQGHVNVPRDCVNELRGKGYKIDTVPKKIDGLTVHGFQMIIAF